MTCHVLQPLPAAGPLLPLLGRPLWTMDHVSATWLFGRQLGLFLFGVPITKLRPVGGTNVQ